MTNRIRMPAWTWAMRHQLAAMKRLAKAASTRARASIAKPMADARMQTHGMGVWGPGMALGPAGVRRFRLYRAP
jgi:hypothetical protein